MKNTILLLISILIFVAGALTLISYNDEYAAERLLYQAAKINKEIALKPDVAPPKMLTAVENKLQTILKAYPQTQTASTAHLNLAEFYWSGKKYEQARTVLDQIINTYSENRLLLSRAHFLKGDTYKKEGNWDEALKQYTFLKEEYKDTPLGLGAALYIGDCYKTNKRYSLAEEAYRQAIQFYRKIEQDNKGKPRGYAAANLLVRTYLKLGQPEEAGKVVEEIVHDYPKLLTMLQQVRSIDSIFIKILRKPEKAIELYTQMKDKSDNPKLIKFFETKIKALETQKETIDSKN